MSDLKFVEFDRNVDLEKQRDLFRSAFPETVGTPIDSITHYKWKFEKFPIHHQKKSSFEYAVYSNDFIAGYYAAIPYPYSINNRNCICGMVCDVMTSPKMQGKGLFTKLGFFATQKMQEAGIDFVSGYPIRPEVIPGHKKVGWEIAFKEPIYIRPVSVNSILSSKKIPVLFSPFFNFILNIFNFFFNFFSSSKEVEVQLLTREEFLQLESYDAFFKKWSQSQKNYLIKSKDFLAWRTSAPQTYYKFLIMTKNKELIAVSILRETDLKSIKTLAILDLMFLDSALVLTKSFFAKMYQLAKKEKCDLIAGMVSPFIAQKYNLKFNFFLKSPFIFSIIFKALNEKIKADVFSGEKNWHLMWIDSDDL